MQKDFLAPLVLSTEQAGQRLGVPKRTVFDLIARGELASLKIGKHRRIPDAELQRFVEQRAKVRA